MRRPPPLSSILSYTRSDVKSNPDCYGTGIGSRSKSEALKRFNLKERVYQDNDPKTAGQTARQVHRSRRALRTRQTELGKQIKLFLRDMSRKCWVVECSTPLFCVGHTNTPFLLRTLKRSLAAFAFADPNLAQILAARSGRRRA